jgi:ribonuclease Z
MILSFKILGKPFEDNALYVEIRTGRRNHRLLFDCGYHCLDELPAGTIMEIDQVFFSHFHSDHIRGIDAFIRHNYNRSPKTVVLWGPADAIRVLGHRLQGFTWNLLRGKDTRWKVHEVTNEQINSVEYRTEDSFARAHPSGTSLRVELISDTEDYDVSAIVLNHIIPVLAYRIRTKPGANIDAIRLQELGLSPGPWAATVKDLTIPGDTPVSIEGREFTLEELRTLLFRAREADSIAYLTDFLFADGILDRLRPFLKGVHTLVCEGSFSDEHAEQAREKHHLTVSQAATIASECGVTRLVLFHLSRRYDEIKAKEMLAAAQTIFPDITYPDQWFGE